jgi:CMP-N-acetylneuraminic acid synthetase
MRLLNYIPCKTTSRRIPQKNIKLYGKQRLVDYTINFANETKSKTLISTDKGALLATFNVDYLHLRSKEEADSNLSNLEVMRRVLSDDKYKSFDYICLLQVTHPVRSLKLYREMLEKIRGEYFGKVMISSFSDRFEKNSSGEGKHLIEGSFYMFPKSLLVTQRSLLTEFWHVPIGNSVALNIDETEDELKFLSYLKKKTGVNYE